MSDTSSTSEDHPPPSGAEHTPSSDTPADDKALAKEAEKLVIVDEKDVGMIPDLKKLYGSKEDSRGRFTWHAKLPEDLGKPAEDADTLKRAIIARYSRVFNDPRRVLALHSVVVQSPLLKDLLKIVLAGYPNVTVGLRRLEFSGNFEPLIHRWTEFKAEIQKLRDGTNGEDDVEQAAERLEHAELLYKLLETEFEETISSSQDMMSQGVITYDLMWTVFQPGCLVYTKVHGQDRVFRMTSQHYGIDSCRNPVYWLVCQFVDGGASSFGTDKLNLKIYPYEGTKAFHTLTAMPFDRHPSMESLREKLVKRGAKVESFAGTDYCAYTGIAWRLDERDKMIKFSVKGRVVLDAYGWDQFNPNSAVILSPLKSRNKETASDDGGIGGWPDDDGGIGGWPDDDGGIGGWPDDDGGIGGWPDDDTGFIDSLQMAGASADDDEKPTRPALTYEQKLICTPVVRGYSLKEKVWLQFFVDSLSDVVFNTRAFESLVLPGNEKELILGFASTPEIYRRQFDDVVEGKGRGMVILLCGPPGTGKTLTAESVAEEMKTPLYMMSAGDLGLDASEVEFRLQRVLDMCTRWNAILLLDEADVFLEQRSLHELERNKLVSIFLRVLEYYDGNMILTTNRVQTFDEAFQSRIMISIQYNELTTESRRTIWSNFLKQHDATQTAARAKPPKFAGEAGTEDADEEQLQHLKRTLPHEISESDLDYLARTLVLNGRQIKNVLKTAQLLALRRGEGLNREHIKLVLNVTQHLLNSTREKESAHKAIFN